MRAVMIVQGLSCWCSPEHPVSVVCFEDEWEIDEEYLERFYYLLGDFLGPTGSVMCIW